MNAQAEAVALAHRYVRQGRGQEAVCRMLRAAGIHGFHAGEFFQMILSNTSSASAGRDEYGGPSKQEGIGLQSVIGLPRCGGEGENPPDISSRASGQFYGPSAGCMAPELALELMLNPITRLP